MTPWQKERLRIAMAETISRPAAWSGYELGGRAGVGGYVASVADFAFERANNLVDVVDQVLFEAAHEHVVVTGVPRAGKTTFAKRFYGDELGECVLHTDDLIDKDGLDWSGVSAHVARCWIGGADDEAKAFRMIEGVAAVRALRKWLEANPEGKPCDRVLWFGEPRIALTGGQAAMAKGCWTVWREVEPQLRSRGVELEVRS